MSSRDQGAEPRFPPSRGEGPCSDTVAEALKIARKAKVTTILNPAPAQGLSTEMLALADVIVPNETELHLLTNLPCDTSAEMEETAGRLHAATNARVLVTLGERGLLSVDEDGARWESAVPVRALDTSGAGDAFIGSLAVFLIQRCPWDEAVRRAMAIAAMTVTRPGTQSSYPTKREAETFLRRLGFH
jgi:ribokinase